MMVALPGILQAAEWSSQPWVKLRTEYSDNMQLRTGQTQEAHGGVLSAGLRLSRTDERGVLSLMPIVHVRRFDSKERLDSDDESLRLDWSRRGEQSVWGMNGEWTRDTTLTSELEVSGLVQARKPRIKRYLSPSFRYSLTSRSNVGVDVAYTTVKYGDALLTGLVDYDYAQADLSVTYLWSEQGTVTGMLYGTRLVAAQIGNRTNSGGVQLQLGGAMTEH